MLHKKKWIIFTILAILTSLVSIGSLNFFMDPLWTFEHSHKYNQYQRGRKERQQKSNALLFKEKKYTTLLFGSSRTTYMNQYKLGSDVFNYAVSDMQPNEYEEYLRFAIEDANQPIKTVIIGLDFFGVLEYAPFISKNPQAILEPILEPFYKYKLLISIDTLDYSLKNITYTLKKPYGKYTYDNVKSTPIYNIKTTKDSYKKRIENDLKTYVKDRYYTDYDVNYKNYLSHLKTSFPKINFIVFTTPVSEQHFKTLISQDLYNDYERWLQESVDVFGQLHHFMFINVITQNAYLYFKDSNHCYTSTYECLGDEILGNPSKCPTIDMILTEENLYEKINLLKSLNFQ